MGRRPLLACLVVSLAAAATSATAARTSWALPQIKAVVGAGVMGPDVPGFRPDDQLTRVALEQLVSGLTHAAPTAVASPNAAVTIAGLDSRLVNALGLADAARTFTQAAKAAGLAPPSRFGTEVTARLLGLRTNHPAAEDALELLPNSPATRAEAAYSAAQILSFRGFEGDALREAAGAFTLPALTPWQQRLLTTAAHFI